MYLCGRVLLAGVNFDDDIRLVVAGAVGLDTQRFHRVGIVWRVDFKAGESKMYYTAVPVIVKVEEYDGFPILAALPASSIICQQR